MPYADIHVGGNSPISPDIASTPCYGQNVPEDWIAT